MGKIARRITLAGLVATQCLVGLNVSFAGDVKIPIPKRGVSTPTEKLNREGVAELKRGHRDKAKQLFYKAYLFDPQDPFTLNNLGYVAELEGDAERALPRRRSANLRQTPNPRVIGLVQPVPAGTAT